MHLMSPTVLVSIESNHAVSCSMTRTQTLTEVVGKGPYTTQEADSAVSLT